MGVAWLMRYARVHKGFFLTRVFCVSTRVYGGSGSYEPMEDRGILVKMKGERCLDGE